MEEKRRRHVGMHRRVLGRKRVASGSIWIGDRNQVFKGVTTAGEFVNIVPCCAECPCVHTCDE